MTKPYHPIRVGLIIPSFVAMGYKQQFIRALESIRQSNHMPWHVVILDFGRGAAFDPAVQQEISNLREFCPDVKHHTFHEYNEQAATEAYAYLIDKDIDVVVNMSDDVVLKPNGLHQLTYGFYAGRVLLIDGSYEVIERPKPWWRAVWWTMTRRVTWKIFAYRKQSMAAILAEGKR